MISSATIARHPTGCLSPSYWVKLAAFAASRGLDVNRDFDRVRVDFEAARADLKARIRALRDEAAALEGRARTLESEAEV